MALASEPSPGADDAELPEQFCLGDYELLEELAEGGMGVVFRARQRSLNRLVALKMIRTGQLAGNVAVQRFRTEAEAAANLDHPGIVPIYEIGEHDGQHYFSMKLIEGHSLAQQIEGGRWRLTADNGRSLQCALAGLLAKVARAVHHAHERAVLHRDLKPSNILVDDQGEPHLTDFGLAKLLERGSELTRSFAVMGTLGYMSPEQSAGKSRQITTSADIYSLGVILFELLTGRLPFLGDDSIEVMRLVTECEPPRPRALNPHVSAELETICLKCLEKSPGRRYGSALELAKDLERWLQHEPIQARPGTAWERAVKWVQRRPLRAALWAVSAVAAVVITGLLMYASRQQRDVTRAQSKVSETVSQIEVHRSQDFFETENPAVALAHLARVLRNNPGNAAAATRLMTALTQRPFPLPLWQLQHDAVARSANYSSDGRMLVTGSDDGVAQIWDAGTGHPLRTLGRHRGGLLAAQFSPDGKRIVTASKDRTARIWNAHTGELLTELPHHWWVRSAEFSPDGERVLTVASNAVVVRAVGGQIAYTNYVSGTHARFAQFDANGQRIVAGSQDGAFFVWQATSGALVAKVSAHAKAVRSARFSPDGRRLVTASEDGTARIWNMPSGQPASPPLQHEGPVVTARFDPSGQWVLTGSSDGTARLWKAEQGSLAGEPFVHGGPVTEAVFSPSGTLVLTGSDDATVRLWEVATGRLVAEPLKHSDFVEQVQFSPDGRQFLTMTADGTTRLWRLPATQPLVQRLFQADDAATYDWCSAGKTVAVVSNEWVTVYDLRSGQPLAPARRELGAESVRVSTGGRFVAAFRTDHTLRLWQTGQLDSKKLEPSEAVTHAEFSADGQKLLTVAGRTLRVWNSEAAEQVAGPWNEEGTVLLAHFNDDAHQIVSVSGKLACVWSVRPGSVKPVQLLHAAEVTWAEFAPDGQHLLTVSQDQTARVWTLSGRQVVALKHGAPVRVAHFSRDGQTVVTTSLGTAKIWNTRNGMALASMHHPREVNSARFSPDGQRLVTAAADQSIRVWEVATGQSLADPIQSDAPVWDARYSDCGRWVMARRGSGPVCWEMPLTPLPLPDWLPEIGEAVAGLRLNAAGLLEPVESGALVSLSERFAGANETNSYVRWVRWFLAEPTTRANSPSAELDRTGQGSGMVRPAHLPSFPNTP